MFLTAYRQFNIKKYLKAAEECGEAIWHRGLVLKGNGLRQGITGNIYPLLTLAKFTRNRKWKVRAYKLALLSFNKDIQQIVSNHKDQSDKS